MRVGDTVRKKPPADPAFVRSLLRSFEQLGWTGAPRFLGTDEQGRETLSFIDGDVPWRRPKPPAPVALAATAWLVRQFHDLTAGTALAGDQEVVCHNDLSPKNTVYRDGEPVAFIDWDLAAPGARVHDVAHLCWQFLDLGPGIPDAAAAGRLLRLAAYTYGLGDPTGLVDTILWWQDRCWRGIDAGADGGDPAMVRLRDHGTVRKVQAAYEWTRTHRTVLEVTGS